MKKFKTKTVLRKDKKNRDGDSPIYLKIIVNQTESAFSSGFFVDEKRWESTHGFRNTKIANEQEIKQDIQDTFKALKQISEQFEKDGEAFNAKMVVNRHFKKDGGGINKNISFLQCFELHKADFLRNNIQERIVEQKQTPEEAKKNATLSHNKYNSTKEKLTDFLKERYRVADMPMKKFDDNIQKDFLFFLKSKLSKNTALRYFINFNAIFHFSERKKLIAEYPFKDDFKIRYEKSKTHSLTIEELHTLMVKKFSTDRLNVVKDIFVWMCLTGYSYNDYCKIKRSNIEERNGKAFVIWNRRKNNEVEDVPLLPDAIALIKKYANHPDCIATGSIMPLRSAVKLNEYLKEIAAVCKINKHFTTKVSRKTFTSILANAGANILPTSKLSGHADSKTTLKHYINIEDQAKIETMEIYQKQLEKQRTASRKKLKVA